MQGWISYQSGKIVGNIMFLIPCFFKLSLSSPFLSAKDHIANINRLYCDFVLLALMVSLLLFP